MTCQSCNFHTKAIFRRSRFKIQYSDRPNAPPAEMIRCLGAVILFSLFVCESHGGCAEVDSLTEAVVGEGFLLGCISCKNREEVSAQATVDWHFKPPEEEEFRHIFRYDHPTADIIHEDFTGRLQWQGTLASDIQIGAIYLHNITFNDTGTYRCTFHRTFFISQFEQAVVVQKEVELSVVTEATPELTAVISKIMMYVLIVILQLWLIGILVYCYKKTAAEQEARETRQALKAQAELEERLCNSEEGEADAP